LVCDCVPYAVEAYPEGWKRQLSGESALFVRMVTEGLFGLPDEDGSVAFGKRASKDPRQNIDMLRRFVKGEYSEGISAAVYTLRGDNYTTDELRGECYGEEAEGGIFFPLSFEAEQDKVYVLCIFSEDGDVSLTLESSEDATAHTVEAGATVVYAGASLSLDFTVRQADRKDIDKFYNACLESDVSGFTKESRKTLNSKMKAAKALLCTQSVTEEECEKVYDELKKAYDGLDTYASEDKIEETPIVGLVLIGIVIVLLIATFLSAMAARKKMNPDS